MIKGFDIWKDDLGRWCVHCKESPYSRESDHRTFRTKKEAEAFARQWKDDGRKPD